MLLQQVLLRHSETDLFLLLYMKNTPTYETLMDTVELLTKRLESSSKEIKELKEDLNEITIQYARMEKVIKSVYEAVNVENGL